MLVKISLIVAMCSGVHVQDVQKKLADLKQANPAAKIDFRIDKKAVCSNGQVLTGKEAKLFEELK